MNGATIKNDNCSMIERDLAKSTIVVSTSVNTAIVDAKI